MTITINSGGQLLIVFGIIFVVIILSMLLKKGDFSKKILSLVIIVVAFGIVFFMFGRPSQLTVNDEGIKSTTYGKINFLWDDVEKAVLVKNYRDTDYKPALKMNGTSVKDFKAGTFKLSNGDNVKLLTQNSDDAAVFYTENGTYLIAIDDLRSMVDIADDYITFE